MLETGLYGSDASLGTQPKETEKSPLNFLPYQAAYSLLSTLCIFLSSYFDYFVINLKSLNYSQRHLSEDFAEHILYLQLRGALFFLRNSYAFSVVFTFSLSPVISRSLTIHKIVLSFYES